MKKQGVSAIVVFSTCLREIGTFQCGKFLDGFPRLFQRNTKVIKSLEIEPKLRAGAKEMAETQGRIARDGARPIQNLRDAIRGDADFAREFGGAHVECLEFFGEMFAGMNYGNGHCVFPNGKDTRVSHGQRHQRLAGARVQKF